MRETGQGPSYDDIMDGRKELERLMHGKTDGRVTNQQFEDRLQRLAQFMGWHDIVAMENPTLPFNLPGMTVANETRTWFSQFVPTNFVSNFLSSPGPRGYEARLTPIAHKEGVEQLRREQELKLQQEIEKSKDMGRDR